MTIEQKLEIAEQRIEEAKDRQKSFLKQYQATGQELYKDMAQSEAEIISKIQAAITETLLANK